jgi:hypothetical protein
MQRVGRGVRYHVGGEHDTYSVWLNRGREAWTGGCSCPAIGICSHLIAAASTEADALGIRIPEPPQRSEPKPLPPEPFPAGAMEGFYD